MEAQEPFLRAAVWLLAATLAVTALFAAVPALDLWVSAGFYDETRATWYGDRPDFIFLRDIARFSTYAVLIAAFVMMVAALFLRGASESGWRVWAYPVATVMIGPGLIANAILKAQFGRARPDAVSEFGGSGAFTPAYQISDQCLRNCSFVSGEAAMMAAVVIPLLVLIWPHLSPAGRWFAVLVGVVAMTGTGMLRVMMGRHFFSDVVLAALFSAIVALVLYRLLDIARAREGFRPEPIRRELRLIASRPLAPRRGLIGAARTTERANTSKANRPDRDQTG